MSNEPLPDNAPHVLVVDDDQKIRDLLARFLFDQGFRVTTAENAANARAALRGLDFDVILLDVMMPKLNGFQTCRRLKADPATARTPVVIVTTKDQPADELWAREVGAEAFLPKPVDLTHLTRLLDRLTTPA